MRMLMRTRQVVIALASVLLVADAAYAQGSIVGIVRDTSGAVLPGVTVEAASPALIEKVRSGVTDGTGQYQIPGLTAGTYSVTFTLPGFNTFQRDGVELAGTFTATVNADLRVGSLEETITVTGETPTVDVQSTTRQQVVTREILDTIPAGRASHDFSVLIPGTQRTAGTPQDVGGSAVLVGPHRTTWTHGARGESLLTRNGVVISGQAGAENTSTMNINPTATQEVVIDTVAGNVQGTSGGTRLNYIPREGANTFSGSVFFNFANSSMQGNNFDSALQASGLRTPDSLKLTHDFNPGFGGPIKRDRAWFFVSARHYILQNYASGAFFNLNENKPDVWTYDPDLSRPAYNEAYFKDLALRVSWQASAKNKVGFYWQEAPMIYYPFGASVTTAPEAAAVRTYPIQRTGQVDWTSPINNEFFLEAGANFFRETSSIHDPPGINPAMISVQEQSSGLIYRAPAISRESPRNGIHLMGAASYLTGTHAVKVGFTHTHGYNEFSTAALNPVSYRFNNGVPNRITLTAARITSRTNVNSSLGLYAQDKWNVKRLTTTYGLRFDRIDTGWPAQTLGPGPLTPMRNITFPAGSNINWKDLTPRFGAVYDVFGSGKTALKVSLNKYLEGMSAGLDIVTAPNPVNTHISSTTRSWNDANRNFVPDCNMLLPGTNGECGALANRNFGLEEPDKSYDPDLMRGWGKRMYNWEFSVGVQHEFLPRMSVDVGYFRRSFGNLRTTINRAAPASAFDFFDMTAPLDPGLPGGGGYPVTGVYHIKPTFFGLVDDFTTHSTQIERWEGADLVLSLRPRGVLVQGGVSTGQSTTDLCDVMSKYPGAGFGANASNASGLLVPLGFCRQNTPWLTQVKFMASYTVPRVDIAVSASLQNNEGVPIFANYVLTNAAATQILGRPLSGGAANITVPIVSGSPGGNQALQTGTLWGPRINQLDLRFSKRFQLGGTRTTLNLDVYNAMNSNAALGYNTNFAAFARPTQILLARFAKIGAQIEF